MKISPEIKATDRDPGPAGKISQVQIWESDEPFVLELQEVSGKFHYFLPCIILRGC